MSLSFAFLRDVKPYKTNWKVQVKVLHTWKQYSQSNGETLEMILADIKGTKIHGSIKKDLVGLFENDVEEGEWKWIIKFGVASSFGKFRPTSMNYKINFLANTKVEPSESLSDSYFLSLANFNEILSGALNAAVLIDVVGQVVNVGEIQTFDINNKQTKKLDLELRDNDDLRLPLTLWGIFAEQVFRAADKSNGKMVICLLRFGKIHRYKDVISVSNVYDTSQLRINPPYKELDEFKEKLPKDGMILTILETKPRSQIVSVNDDFYLQYPTRPIGEILNSTEVGRVKVICSIFAIDTDWAWYYLAHQSCNKKVKRLEEGDDGFQIGKPKFRCPDCKKIVTNLTPRYKLHVKVMDSTGEIKCMLFDSMALEIVGQSASRILGGFMDEIEDPENIPEPIKNLIGKTYQFVLCVEKENHVNEHHPFKVAKVLSSNGLLQEEQIPSDSFIQPNPDSFLSGDQDCLMLTYSQDNSTNTNPSKRMSTDSSSASEQSSTTKKLCIEETDVQDKLKALLKVKVEKTSELNE